MENVMKKSPLSKEETNRNLMQKYYKEHILILTSKDLLNEGEKIHEKKGFEASFISQLNNLTLMIENMKKGIEGMKYQMKNMNDKMKNMNERI